MKIVIRIVNVSQIHPSTKIRIAKNMVFNSSTAGFLNTVRRTLSRQVVNYALDSLNYIIIMGMRWWSKMQKGKQKGPRLDLGIYRQPMRGFMVISQ